MKSTALYILSGLLFSTCRIKISGDVPDKGKSNVIAFWHGKMLVGWRVAKKLTANLRAVVSPSRDGQILTDYLGKIGLDTIRGSSDKSPKELLKEIESYLEAGTSIAITPDGPRGPIHEAKPGAVVAAVRSDAELYGLEITMSKSKELGSWDKFEIPLPFSTIEVKVKRIELENVSIANRQKIDELISELEGGLGG